MDGDVLAFDLFLEKIFRILNLVVVNDGDEDDQGKPDDP